MTFSEKKVLPNQLTNHILWVFNLNLNYSCHVFKVLSIYPTNLIQMFKFNNEINVPGNLTY